MAEQAKVNNDEVAVKDLSKKEQQLLTKTLEEIRSLAGGKFTEKRGKNEGNVSFFGEGRTRLLKLIETKRGLKIEFNVEVPERPGLVTLTPEEAKAKHMGTCRWIYTVTDINEAKEMIKAAIDGFVPKKRADSFEEKEKAKKAQQEEKSKEKAEKEDDKSSGKEDSNGKDSKKAEKNESKMTDKDKEKLKKNKEELKKAE